MQQYGLIGKSLSHSFSKKYFNSFFSENNIDAVYDEFEIHQIEDVNNVLNRNDLSGLNVTIPYKEKIIPFLDELSSEAKEIGAVNTIKITGGKKIGYNTDAFGFHQSIKPFLTKHHDKAIVFGTGGASKAVTYVLKKIGIEVFFVSRTPDYRLNQFSYDQLNENMIRSCKLIINTTPLGMYPKIKSCVSLDWKSITDEHFFMDLIYNPEETLFLKRAKKNNAFTLNGQNMLVEQAKKSWGIWSSK
ncbi:MAG: shikimate dehydrogenase [Crocinitomicaceae bacterium]|nr:shikimate dehydrogenase [Crocinitomicaceae bacterium]